MIQSRNTNANSLIMQMNIFQESLSLLSEERFFDIVRMYLGEIQTPFNKQRLFEQLTGFLLNQENQKRLVSLLSELDLKLISAISLISNITQDRLCDFFREEYQVSEIYTQLLNLTERLIILNQKNPQTDELNLVVNPLLTKILNPFVNINLLIPSVVCVEKIYKESFSITPQFIAGLFSYIQHYPDMCKNDGSIKKKDLERLCEIFPEKIECVKLLIFAFMNLGLIKQGEKFITIDEGKINSFAQLQSYKQYAYLCASATTRLGRESLRVQTQILLDTIASIPQEGTTRSSLLKIAFLVGNKINNRKEDFPRQSRFSRLIEANRLEKQKSHISEQTKDFANQIMDRIVDCAVEFGLLSVVGKTEDGCEIYQKGFCFEQGYLDANETNIPKTLNINAGTKVTILPGLSLKNLIPFISFMDIISCGTVAEFEITRQSISRGFDKGLSISDIYQLLEKHSTYEIPKSLKVNIEDWYNSYYSAMLFKGYVLKVDEKNIQIVEQNPKITPFIQMKLADGIYLLNIPVDEDCSEFISKCGLDFIGNVKTAKKEFEVANFPLISNGRNLFEDDEIQNSQLSSINNVQNTVKDSIKELINYLDTLKLTEQQRSCLLDRIYRKVVISTEQLNPDYVRYEVFEATGMEYMGKLRLIENAVSSKDMLEISIPADNDSARLITYLGTAIQITKGENDSFVKIQIEPDKIEKFFSVSKIAKVKLIKKYM